MLKRKTKSSPEAPQEAHWPPPLWRSSPEPRRRRMPDGWKPEKPFDYLIIEEDFNVGSAPFRKGQHVRSDHALANKLLYECPEWVHPVRLDELNHRD